MDCFLKAHRLDANLKSFLLINKKTLNYKIKLPPARCVDSIEFLSMAFDFLIIFLFDCPLMGHFLLAMCLFFKNLLLLVELWPLMD